MDLWALLIVPLGLGLLGFVEPCTVGSSLLFVKYLEGKPSATQILEMAVFAATRAVFIGGLGALAAFLGSAFLPVQRGFWVLLGAAYVVLGGIYLTGKHATLMRVLGPTLRRAHATRGAATLGVLFGLNIPACAAPLLAAVFAATLGAASVRRGFLVMAVFGLALSLPLVTVVLWPRARRWLDWLASFSDRSPFWTGIVFLLLVLQCHKP